MQAVVAVNEWGLTDNNGWVYIRHPMAKRGCMDSQYPSTLNSGQKLDTLFICYLVDLFQPNGGLDNCYGKIWDIR